MWISRVAARHNMCAHGGAAFDTAAHDDAQYMPQSHLQAPGVSDIQQSEPILPINAHAPAEQAGPVFNDLHPVHR